MPNVTITCPSCGLSREVPRERVPATTVQVSCPTCGHSFRLSLVPTQLTSAENAPEKAPDAPLPGLSEQSLQQGGRRSRGLLLFFVLLIISLVGVRIWAEGKQRAVTSPNFLAASETCVAISWGDEVMLFDHNGQLTGRQPLPRGAVLTQLFFVGNELWHADVTGNAIRRLRNGAWETVVNGGPRFRAAFKVAVDAEGGEIFVSDSANHTIHYFRGDGTYVRSFGREGKGQGKLKFPNSLLFDRDGNLIVVNTNCLRVDLFSRDGRFLRTLLTADAVGPHKYPTLMARAGDRFAFLKTADLRRAVVMVYGDDGRAVGQLPRPVPLEDAGDVAAFGSTVLVSDIGHRQVHRFDAATLDYTGPFSSAIVQRAAEARQTEMRYADLSRYALVALLVCCLPVFYLYYQTRQREVNRLAKVNTGTVIPAEALLGTLVDHRKVALAAALVVAWVLLKLYATSLVRENHTLIPLFFLVHTWLSVAAIRIFMGSGITSPSRRGTLAKMVRASLTSLSKLLSDGERVVLCTAFRKGTYAGQPSLLLLTDRRILIVDFSYLHPVGFWQFGYGDIADVVQEQASSRIAAITRFMKIDQHFLTLSLRPGAGTERLQLYGVGGTVSDRVTRTLAQLRSGPSLGYRKLCTTCFTPLDASGCPRCSSQRKGDWKPLLLSLLYPGMGQFYNREIFKGTVFSVLFTFGVLDLTRPLTHIMARTAEVSPESVPYLTSSVLTLVLIYLVALADADLLGRQGKRLFSMEFFRRRW